MEKKFKNLISVRASLIFLYLALTIPLPIIASKDLKLIAISLFALGFFIIIDITNDYLITCENKISYKVSFTSSILGKKSWEIFWKDIKLIKSLPTSQGSKVHYFVTNKEESFLVPQRIENFQKFLSIISIKTNLEVNELSYLSPLWTYKLLASLSISMIIGEIVFYLV